MSGWVIGLVIGVSMLQLGCEKLACSGSIQAAVNDNIEQAEG